MPRPRRASRDLLTNNRFRTIINGVNLQPNHRTFALLRVALAFLLFWSLIVQVAIPFAAQEMALDYRESAPMVGRLAWPYSIAAILAILCGQVAIYFIYRLLSMVSRGEIFRVPSSRFTSGIINCFAIATGLAVLVSIAQVIIPDGGHFSTLAITLSATTLGAVLTLLMIVLRGMLADAVEYRGELDTVI